jgi:hypothetical protein
VDHLTVCSAVMLHSRVTVLAVAFLTHLRGALLPATSTDHATE